MLDKIQASDICARLARYDGIYAMPVKSKYGDYEIRIPVMGHNGIFDGKFVSKIETCLNLKFLDCTFNKHYHNVHYVFYRKES